MGKMTQEEAEALSKELSDLAIARGAEAVVVAVMGPGLDEWPEGVPCVPNTSFRQYGYHTRTIHDGTNLDARHWLKFLVRRLASHFDMCVSRPASVAAFSGPGRGGGGAGSSEIE